MTKNFQYYAEDTLHIVTETIQKYGSRVSGTTGCYESAEYLKNLLKKSCSTIKKESFFLAPHALFSIGKLLAATYTVGVVSILINLPISILTGYLCILFGTLFCITQFLLYRNTFDFLFKKVVGNNIIGIVKPSGPNESNNVIKKQIIIVSHHDSSPVYSFYENYPKLFPLRLLLLLLFFSLCHIALFLSMCNLLLYGMIANISSIFKYLLLGGFIIILPMYNYMSKKGSPGAGDNLIGCAICIKLAELFQKEKTLKNTQLLFVLTDGEEIGQKGAKFFIKNNKQLLSEIKTTIINIDSIYNYEDLAFIKRDRNYFTRLSKIHINKIIAVAKELGHDLKTISIPFGGGGTDGGQFARNGIETISIIGMPVNLFREEIVFHTPKDTPDKIKIDSVKAVMEIIYTYIKKEDK